LHRLCAAQLTPHSQFLAHFSLQTETEQKKVSRMATISGGNGDNTLTGTASDDTIAGGAGNDTIEGGAGNDVIDGGTGDGDSIPGGHNDDDLIFGGEGDDTITGNDGNDTIFGGVGNDSLRGDEGADRLAGGAGDDTLNFTDLDNAEDVYVLGNGDGADTLIGFAGPVDDGMGGFTSEDKFDLSGMTDGLGGPVEVWDIVVSDDGLGNAVLTFPDGTSTTLIGIAPSEVSSYRALHSMGIPCFAAGTRIMTDQGAVPIETLVEGDLVLTRDDGLQPIRWIGKRTVDASGDLAPIRIAAGTFGNARDLRVSPQHRILVAGWQAELLFGEEEVLAPAKSLVNDTSICRQPLPAITYCHMLFERHQIVLSEGMWTESLHTGKEAMDSMTAQSQQEILRIFPELALADLPHSPLARPTLSTREGRVLAKYL
jgi:hypothetical protein